MSHKHFDELQRPASNLHLWRFWCVSAAVIVAVLLLILAWPTIRGAREAAPRSQCRNNLKQIGIALHSYHEKYGSLPPAFVADAAGRPMHSWRVLLLPFLDDECRAIYGRFSLSEPWDSPQNVKLLAARPAVFSCRTRDRTSGDRQNTSYAAIVGNHSVFHGAKPIEIDEIVDGTDRTLVIAEVTEANIPWTKPEDIDIQRYPRPGDRHGCSSDHERGFNALLANGRVCFVSEAIKQATFDSLVTRNGREVVEDDDF